MICNVVVCGRIIDNHGAKGMCHKCYERTRRDKNRHEINKKRKIRYRDDSEFRNRMNLSSKTIHKKTRIEDKIKVINHYSGGTNKCSCKKCNISGLNFLTIDHINKDGGKQRKLLKMYGGGVNFYHWLIKNNLPEGYQVLCYNCNCSKGFFGYCHE